MPWPIFAAFDSAQFLDNGIYVAASLVLLYMAGNLLPQAAAASPSPPSGAQGAVLRLEDQTIPISMLRAAHAAGNYTELEFLDGTRRLFRVALRSLFETPPHPLMRVHRSHAVNLERVERLRVESGSRYHLELDNGCRIPVSRSVARVIRAALSTRISRDDGACP